MFVTLGHDYWQDLTLGILTKIYKNAEVEPKLLLVARESFENRTTNIHNKAKAEMWFMGFWVTYGCLNLYVPTPKNV